MRKKNTRHALEFEDDGEDRLDIWQRLSRVLIALFVLALIAGSLSMFWPQLDRHREIDRKLVALTTTRDELAVERDDVKKRLGWLRTDPAFLETVARDRLDRQKDGEIIFRIERFAEGDVE